MRASRTATTSVVYDVPLTGTTSGQRRAVALAGEPTPPVRLSGLTLRRLSQRPVARQSWAIAVKFHSSPSGRPSLAIPWSRWMGAGSGVGNDVPLHADDQVGEGVSAELAVFLRYAGRRPSGEDRFPTSTPTTTPWPSP